MRVAPRALRRLVMVASVVTMVVVSGLASAGAATDPNPPFAAGARWTGEFADPALLRVGSTYYAFATVTGGDNLPVSHSTDLSAFYARSAYPANSNPGWWAGYNDAMPHPARWAVYDVVRNGRSFTRPWAPSIARIGSHYVLAYSAPDRASNSSHRCISVATSTSPQGPFADTSSGPIVCSSDTNGSNDPFLFVAPNGTPYLEWKNAGVAGHTPTRVYTRQLNSAGTGFAAGSVSHLLLETKYAWEGTVIENPAMIYYGGRYFLFYSGNGYDTARYAIGYAECASPIGSCKRRISTALLASAGSIAGPGGPAPVVGPDGALRLGYAAWDAGHVGYENSAYNHRRLHVARLWVGGAGLVHVSTLG